MAIIQLKNIFKQFSGDFILKNISFSIENKDKIAEFENRRAGL